MTRHAPRTQLATHEVANQPGEFAGVNLFTTDIALRSAVARNAPWLDARAAALGQDAGSEEVLAWGEDANRNPPELTGFDRYGRRIDEARFHPSYHALMDLAMRHGIHDVAWELPGRAGGHVGHAVLLALFTQAEAGVMCPINMTYAAVPALRAQRGEGEAWAARIVGGRYDAKLRPIAEKAGITVGMAMTEKQGGSDVRANTTRAHAAGGREFRLVGHKWFCSAPMSDGFLTLAYSDGGLSCFLAPRIRPVASATRSSSCA